MSLIPVNSPRIVQWNALVGDFRPCSHWPACDGWRLGDALAETTDGLHGKVVTYDGRPFMILCESEDTWHRHPLTSDHVQFVGPNGQFQFKLPNAQSDTYTIVRANRRVLEYLHTPDGPPGWRQPEVHRITFGTNSTHAGVLIRTVSAPSAFDYGMVSMLAACMILIAMYLSETCRPASHHRRL